MFIIAEIGINHNGDLDIAKKLIDVSKDAGVDAVKFQKRNIYKVYNKEKLKSFRESPWGKTEEDQKKGLELGEKEYDEINKYCKEKKIHWLASAWDLDSLKFLDKYDFKYNKIASPMLASEKFLNEVAERKKYTFISTGMSDIKMISNAVDIFRGKDCEFELMYCKSVYPCPKEIIDLNTIKYLKNKFNCKVGYSGHEGGIAITIAAVALGASSIERHITLDRTMYGSDQAASIEPLGLKNMVSSIKKIIPTFEGKNGEIKINDEEKPQIDKLRAHLNNI
ncbi:N-acetylneuraminate synthase family protein [Candidatus Pelagibacter sp.]|uniref:N-acetylneuraminate synthase family protein n=1 Tax=Candidatus Pelagibacter sp. TaxID=2024849 RepID=UPI003F82B5A8